MRNVGTELRDAVTLTLLTNARLISNFVAALRRLKYSPVLAQHINRPQHSSDFSRNIVTHFTSNVIECDSSLISFSHKCLQIDMTADLNTKQKCFYFVKSFQEMIYLRRTAATAVNEIDLRNE